MRAKIQKWGNSLAVRIPKVIANEIQLRQGSEVNLVSLDGKIVVSAMRKKYNLSELLSKTSRKNTHAETKTHKRRGREVW